MHRQRKRISGFERFESRRCLSAGGLVQDDVDVIETFNIQNLVDVDTDGDLDMVSFSPKIQWNENIDGRGTFAKSEILAGGITRIDSAWIVDFDFDGDRDALFSRLSHPKLGWLENADGNGRRWTEQAISTSFFGGIRDVANGDIDSDGDLDLIALANSGEIHFFENLNPRSFAEGRMIAADIGRKLRLLDFDQDGDLDVVFPQPATINWLENTDGKGTWSDLQSVSYFEGESQGGDADIADFDGDGDFDVFFVGYVNDSKSLLFDSGWGENKDGKFEVKLLDEVNDRGTQNLFLADVDGDEDLDVIYESGKDDTNSSWYENTASGFSWRGFIRSEDFFETGEIQSIGDVDSDGDVEIYTSSYQASVYEHRFEQDLRDFGPTRILAIDTITRSISAGDLDGDGDLDLLRTAYENCHELAPCRYFIGWYENKDNEFGKKQVVEYLRNQVPEQVFATDFDADGDLDILVSINDMLTWYENTDGKGQFSKQTALNIPKSDWYQLGDLDGDDRIDVVAVGGGIRWYRNQESGEFKFVDQIGNQPDVSVAGLLVTDIDGDRDLDVISQTRQQIVSFENQNGRFGAKNVVADVRKIGDFFTEPPYFVDIDGDQDLDLVTTNYLGDFKSFFVVWFENLDGNRAFGPERVIVEGDRRVLDYLPIDMDDDGRTDMVVGKTWYRNQGDGSFLLQYDVAIRHSTQIESNDMRMILDIDADGDDDVVVAGQDSLFTDGFISWFERRTIGDVDNDGQFGTGDLVRVFQAGKYEDGIGDNASFEDGDWNADGDFDSGDLVFAFAFGDFVTASIENRHIQRDLFSLADDDRNELPNLFGRSNSGQRDGGFPAIC